MAETQTPVPPRPGSSPPARERILDAAEARLLRAGPAGLVLAEVALEAGCSKGGLLYHFPSKDALIDGLRDRMLTAFDARQAELAASDPEPAGVWSRAYLDSTVTREGEPADGSAQLMASLLALVGNAGDKLRPLQDRFGDWHDRLEQDGIDPELAIIVRLAADGLWLSAMLGLPSPDAARMQRVVERLREMTRAIEPGVTT